MIPRYVSLFFTLFLTLFFSNAALANSTNKNILVLGTRHVLNQNNGPKNSLVFHLQKEFEQKLIDHSFTFINGGIDKDSLNDIVEGAQIKIQELRPTHTILVTGTSDEIMKSCLTNLDMFSNLCPLAKINSASREGYLKFLATYLDSIRRIKISAEALGSKFIVVFLGGHLTQDDLKKKLRLCLIFTNFLKPLGIQTNLITQAMIDSKFNVLYSQFFSRIIARTGGINAYGEFSPKGNRQLAQQMSFWLLPELLNN